MKCTIHKRSSGSLVVFSDDDDETRIFAAVRVHDIAAVMHSHGYEIKIELRSGQTFTVKLSEADAGQRNPAAAWHSCQLAIADLCSAMSQER